MTFRLVYVAAEGDWAAGMARMEQPIADAASAAIADAGQMAKQLGRASIAAGGFGPKWQNTWTLKLYPGSGKPSINSAAFLFHKIPYARVFEEGATIRGKPMLWIPLTGTPKTIGRQRMTPELYRQQVGPLFSLNRGGHPLLAAKVRMASGTASSLNRNISVAQLRNGRTRGNGVFVTIPLFVGVPTVNLKSRFSTERAAEAARAQLGALYFEHLRTGDA